MVATSTGSCRLPANMCILCLCICVHTCESMWTCTRISTHMHTSVAHMWGLCVWYACVCVHVCMCAHTHHQGKLDFSHLCEHSPQAKTCLDPPMEGWGRWLSPCPVLMTLKLTPEGPDVAIVCREGQGTVRQPEEIMCSEGLWAVWRRDGGGGVDQEPVPSFLMLRPGGCV